MRLQSSSAVLDVKRGRKALLRRIKRGPVRVIIEGDIDCEFGGDDGESQEFVVNVRRVTCGIP